MDFEKIKKCVASMAGSGFRVCRYAKGSSMWFYICSSIGEQSTYLWKDGSINPSTGYKSPGCKATDEQEVAAFSGSSGFWDIKAEAVEFLLWWEMMSNDTKELDYKKSDYTYERRRDLICISSVSDGTSCLYTKISALHALDNVQKNRDAYATEEAWLRQLDKFQAAVDLFEVQEKRFNGEVDDVEAGEVV